jgi:hypothetical protein
MSINVKNLYQHYEVLPRIVDLRKRGLRMSALRIMVLRTRGLRKRGLRIMVLRMRDLRRRFLGVDFEVCGLRRGGVRKYISICVYTYGVL